MHVENLKLFEATLIYFLYSCKFIRKICLPTLISNKKWRNINILLRLRNIVCKRSLCFESEI